jgi:general stress protein 26
MVVVNSDHRPRQSLSTSRIPHYARNLDAISACNKEVTVALPQFQFQEVENAIIDLLAEQELGVLATVRADGSPSASLMSFAGDGLTVYCHAFGSPRKLQDLRRDPRVAYTLANLPDTERSGNLDVRMIQMSGDAVFVDDPAEIDRAVAICAKQFRWLADDRRRGGFERDARAGRLAFFRIQPREALWNDNRVGAAWRVLVSFTAEGHVAGLKPYGPVPP